MILSAYTYPAMRHRLLLAVVLIPPHYDFNLVHSAVNSLIVTRKMRYTRRLVTRIIAAKSVHMISGGCIIVCQPGIIEDASPLVRSLTVKKTTRAVPSPARITNIVRSILLIFQ